MISAQFIPETWRLYGWTQNNDSKVRPDNFDDAALSAAGVCALRDLIGQAKGAGWTVIEHPDEILFCIGHRGLDIDPEPDQTAVGGAPLQHHRPQKSEQRLARVLGLRQCVPIVDDPAEPVLDDRPE